MAVREPAPKGLLSRFGSPLWERLRLEDLKPEWIVKGQHRGYDWMAIELTHRATGLVMGSERLPDTTTVFVLRLPRKSRGWHLPGDRITPTQQVCVDDECVYAAALGRQPRVRDWRRWLDIAADAADEVVRNERPLAATGAVGTASSAHAAGSDAGHDEGDEPVWNPHDGRWVLFWTIVALALGGGILLLLAIGYNDWQRHGAIVQCNAATHLGTVLRGWKMWLYLGLLATPLLGIGRLLHTMATRMHRPGFTLQINVEGTVLLVAAFALSQALGALQASARGAC